MLRTHENRYAEQLDMVYKGNRLTKVSKNGDTNLEYDFQGYPDKADASTEMTYDPNGNMTADLDRGIVAIRYNLLNLPDTVQFENGNRIVYFYYAGGERAGAVTTTYSTPISVPLDSVYLGEDPHFDMWEHRHGNLFYKMGSPSRLLFDNGFFELAERHGGLISQIPYVFVRDHLGSVRLVCNGNTGEVVQSLEYLPSGVIFRSRNFDRQPYRFTGKELLSAHGLDWYDSGARMQEFHIPRFTTMDPLCEKYYSTSPYAYCNNNPVKYIDPDGKIFINSIGQIVSYDSKYRIWNSAATADIRKIGNEMVKTETGKKALRLITENRLRISMGISSKYDNAFGTTVQSEKKSLTDLDIFINEDKIIRDKDIDANFKKLTVAQVIGAVATHEAGHTTEENRKIINERNAEIKRDPANKDAIIAKYKDSVEKGPSELEKKWINEALTPQQLPVPIPQTIKLY